MELFKRWKWLYTPARSVWQFGIERNICLLLRISWLSTVIADKLSGMFGDSLEWEFSRSSVQGVTY